MLKISENHKLLLPDCGLNIGLLKDPKEESLAGSIKLNEKFMHDLSIFLQHKGSACKEILERQLQAVEKEIAENENLTQAHAESKEIQEKLLSNLKDRLANAKAIISSKEKELY